jgi:phospholipid/cholesterol/gamma-HCH transport system substrate-binding protein
MRGTKYAPGYHGGNASPGRAYGSSYDPMTGVIAGVTDAAGNPVRLRDPGNLSVLGGDSWKWLLVGPVTNR